MRAFVASKMSEQTTPHRKKLSCYENSQEASDMD
jgi:hypothetical protein